MKIESVNQGVNTTPVRPHDKREVAEARSSEAGKPDSVKSDAEASRQALNASILKASMEVSLSAGNHSMSLLYKTAIENLNQVLAPELGENAIQAAADSGLDFSPEATAERIVSMSTAFFGKYAENHPEKDLETALNDFAKLIGGGIDKGFAEARQILDGLQVLKGDIASNIDKTYDLVQSGLKSFVENYPRPDKADAASSESAV